ncbi:hypothetical protein [Croceicoccus sp. Ery15]|uniref:hypothetical protein n=1 Tax=Croceicoccus sp. Ery15 TaxID=1703338 RepID=UPI001E3DBCF2|nr:hypothetical protein [Croceicoccus sp. Ery15]
MELGAATHFSQGWQLDTIDRADEISVTLLRDEMEWDQAEITKGKIDFTGATAQKLEAACARGKKLLLVQIPTNPNYDGGKFVYSPASRAAFAKFLRAVADHFGSCIAAFEIGNEINGGGGLGLSYPDGYDLEDTYIALLKDIEAAMGSSHDDIRILGGSTNLIGTGYLEKFFAAGILNHIDGVAVHPYSGYAYGLPMEIALLKKAMRDNGKEVEIWASEFAHDHTDQKLAASEGIKSITLMAAAGVDAAIWYALFEERWFPNLGLFDGSTIKQQGRAVRLATTKLLPHGNPVKLNTGDSGLFAYRYGKGATVVWGTPRTIQVEGATEAYDAYGNRLPSNSQMQVSDVPVIFIGGNISDPGTSNVLADTLLQFGTGDWTYFARSRDGGMNPLTYTAQWYTSDMRSAWDAVLALGPDGAVPARDASDPLRALWQWQADKAMSVTVTACFHKRQEGGDGIDLSIDRNGNTLTTKILSNGRTQISADIDLAAGDKVMVSAGPNQTWGNDAFGMRAKVFKRGTASAVECPSWHLN